MFIKNKTIVKVINRPCEKGARSYSENKRELSFLLQEFDFARQNRVALREQIREEKRLKLLSFKNLVSESKGTYASLVKRQGCVSSAIITVREEEAGPIMSRNQTRRLDRDLEEKAQQERAYFKHLAESIARRKTTVRVIVPKSAAERARERALKEFKKQFLQASRKLFFKEKRAVREVEKMEGEEIPSDVDSLVSTSGWISLKPKRDPPGQVVATSQRQIKEKKKVIHSSVLVSDNVVRQELPKFSKQQHRFEILEKLQRTSLGRLLAGVLERRWNCRYQEFADQLIEPQMMSAEDKGAKPSVIVAANTALGDVMETSASTAISTTSAMSNFAHDASYQGMGNMAERWLHVKTEIWKTTNVMGSNIVLMELPGDVFKSHSRSPNIQPFLIHKWFRGDIQVKLQINSNRFQVGSLLLSSFYRTQQQYSTLNDYITLPSILQRNYVLVSAGDNNDGIINIPYQSLNSLRSTKDSKFVSVAVHVFNPLIVSGSVQNSCSISLYVSFKNMKFYATIARAEPQMMAAAELVNAGSNLVRTIRGDNNRDKPPMALQPMSFIPQTTTSLAYMTGIEEPVNALRADPTGQVPSVAIVDEMSINYMISKWSLLVTKEWSISNSFDYQLFRAPAAPLPAFLDLPYTEPKTLTFCPSTLNYMASMFGYWRGDIEFKIQVIGGGFYSGRLMMAAVPYTTGLSISAEDARASAFEIFDIASSQEAVFTVPWYWENSFCPVRTDDANYKIPSYFYLFVANPLIGVDSVPNKIYINIYTRAGRNFEVSIPRAASIAPASLGKVVIPANETVSYYNRESFWYITNNASWYTTLSGVTLYPVVAYIQKVFDGWVGYNGLGAGYIYSLGKTSKGLDFRVRMRVRSYKSEVNAEYTVSHGVYVPQFRNSNAQAMMLFATLDYAQKCADAVVSKRSFWDYLNYYTEDGPWSEVRKAGSEVWEIATDHDDPPVWTYVGVGKKDAIPPKQLTHDTGSPTFEDLEDFQNLVVHDRPLIEVIQPQMETSILVKPSSLTQCLKVFGEQALDLKSLCRRFNHLGSIKVDLNVTGQPRDLPFAVRFPVSPTRYVSPTTAELFDNRWRNGTITSIASLYYLFRGGLRYKFMVVGNPPEGTIIYVQHRFDKFCSPYGGFELGPKTVNTLDDMMNTQYATYTQSLNVNSSFSIEVPFYSEKEAISSYLSRDAQECTIGSLYVWFHTKDPAPIHIEVFYALADDARFSCFQGCPKSIDLHEMVPQPQPQMGGETVSVMPIPKFLTAPFRLVNDAATSLKAIGSLSAKLDNLVEQFAQTFSKISKSMVSGAENVLNLALTASDGEYSSFNMIISQFIHILLNPSVKTIVWAITSILVNIFGDFVSLSLTLSKTLTNFIMGLLPSQRPQEDNPLNEEFIGVPSPQYEDRATMVGVIFSLVTSACRISMDPIKDIGSLYRGLFTIGQASKSSQSAGILITDFMTLVSRVVGCVITRLQPDKAPDYSLIADEKDQRLKRWLIESMVVLDPVHKDKILTNLLWASRCAELAVVGRMVQGSCALEKSMGPLMPTINENMRQFRLIENDLINAKVWSGSTYEPMVIWSCGGPGTFKSTLIDYICGEYARIVQDKNPSSYHALTAGQKYYDQYTGQKSLFVDDFGALSPQQDAESYAQFLQLKSSSAFNPPFSRVEDKNKLVDYDNAFYTSNFTHFMNVAGIHDVGAYNRRRDLIIEHRFRDPRATPQNLREMYSQDDLNKFKHLIIGFKNDKMNAREEDFEPIDDDPDHSYFHTVVKEILRRIMAYHRDYLPRYQAACKRKRDRLDETEQESDLDRMIDEMAKVVEESDPKFKDVSCNRSALGIKERLLAWKSTFTAPERGRLPNHLPDIPEGINGETDPGDPPELRVHQRFPPHPDMMRDLGIEPQSGGSNSKGGFPSNTQSLSERKMSEEKENTEWNNRLYEYPIRFQGSQDITCLELYKKDQVVLPVHPTKWYGHTAENKIDEFTDCIHNRVYKVMQNYTYSKDLACYITILPFDRDVPCSLPAARCCKYDPASKQVKPLKNCCFNYAYVYQMAIRGANKLAFLDDPECECEGTLDYIPEEFHDWFKMYVRQLSRRDDWRGNSTQLRQQVLEKLIHRCRIAARESYTPVGNTHVRKRSLWTSVSDIAWKGICSLLDMMFKILGHLIQATAVFGLLSILTMGWEETKATFKRATPNLHPSGDHKVIRRAPNKKQAALRLVEGQSLNMTTVIKELQPRSNFEYILEKIIANTFNLIGMIRTPDEWQCHFPMRCTGLYNKKFIMIKHYYDDLVQRGYEEIGILYHKSKREFICRLDEISFQWTPEGYGIGELPAKAPMMFKNILSYIPSEKMTDMYPRECFILEVHNDSYDKFPVVTQMRESTVRVPDSEVPGWEITNPLQYAWGGKGKCGSLLIAPSMVCPLIGLHTAGIDSIRGYSERLLKETFENEEEIIIEYAQPRAEMGIEPRTSLSGQYLEVAGVESGMDVFSPTKTQIIPSEIQGVFEVSTEPAPLVKEDPRLEHPEDVLLVGVSKRCKPIRDFDKADLDASLNHYSKQVLANVPPVCAEVRPLTIPEAIEGFDGDGWESIPMNTAEGYPWVKMRPAGKKDKRWLFKLGEYPTGKIRVEGIQSDLYHTLMIKQSLREEGIVPLSYFSECTKDARIAKNKIPIPGKTRIFEISPVDLTIAQRQYYSQYTVAYTKSRFEHTIGINPDGVEWSMLANSLKEFSPYILTADYSGYGPSVSHQVLEGVFRARMDWFEWFEPTFYQHRKVRLALMHEIVHGLHIVRDLIFRPTSGLPSGNAETVQLNSEVNSIYIRLAYLGLAKEYKSKYADLYWFNHFVLLFHNGDDLIMSVKEDIISWFNNQTLIEFFAKYGLKMTDAAKSGVVRPWCSLEEATYLKRGFTPHPYRQGQWMAPLNEDSILDTANWVWKSVNHREASLVNSEMCCRLAYTRGKQFYDQVCEKIQKAWLDRCVFFEFPQWESLDNHIWEDAPGPIYRF